MSNRVTLEDIAAASDTSVASVSLALRNKPGVSRARRERILQAARSLGYSRELPVTERNDPAVRTVAVLFRTLDSGTASMMDQFYSWVAAGIQEVSQDQRIRLTLGALRCDRSHRLVSLPTDDVLDSASDGIFLLGSYPDETLERLLEVTVGRGIPIVQVDGESPRTLMDTVGSMNVDGLRRATAYLIDHGHREIGFAGRTGRGIPSIDARFAGYRAAMSEHGLAPQEIVVRGEGRVDFETHEGRLPFTAIAAANDYDAGIVMRVLRSRGFRVPDDVSVIGFDDTEHAVQSIPAMTTMRVDTLAMGRLAVEMMAFRWRWPDAAPIMVSLKPQLVERDSVRSIGAT